MISNSQSFGACLWNEVLLKYGERPELLAKLPFAGRLCRSGVHIRYYNVPTKTGEGVC
jgi:hypothetical protein